MPKSIPAPSATVDRVELVEVTDAGARLLIHVTLANTADEPLPLVKAIYTLKVGDVEYAGNTSPNATLPKLASKTIALPAAITGSPSAAYSVHGIITYRPPGEIRDLMTDVGIPLPTVSFTGAGDVTGQPAHTAVYLVPLPPAAEPPAPEAAPEPAAEPPAEASAEETAPAEAPAEQAATAEEQAEQAESPPATEQQPAEPPAQSAAESSPPAEEPAREPAK